MPNKCLLCVDDDADTLSVRRHLLESSGYSIVTAISAENALTLLAQGTAVDLVLLDYLMPGMSGDDLAQKLRQLYPQLPLIVVSAIGQLPQGLVETVDATIQKGQDPELLLSTIGKVLDRAGAENPHKVKQTILCVEDEELQLKMRRALFESAGYHVLEARSPKIAMQAFSGAHVDAVVMDYWLSGQGENGTALAEEMKRVRPKVPVVMLSGFSPLPGEGAVVDSWIRKAEMEPEKLLNEVQRLIDLRTSMAQSDKPE